MKEKDIPLIYRISILILIIGISMIVNSYSCIMLSLTGVPDRITKNIDRKIDKIILLYGENLCGTCPTGVFLLSLKEKIDILFIVPQEYSQNEIDNLKRSFLIKSKLISGNPETKTYLDRLVSCSKKNPNNRNLYIRLDGVKKIKSIIAF